MREFLFTKIVSMDRSRIPSRLRSKDAPRTLKTRGKKSLPHLLLETVKSVVVPKDGSQNAVVDRMQSHCKQFWRTFERFEKQKHDDVLTSSVDLLEEVITVAHGFQLVK